jgi:2-phosphosulfolactate phosphatase
MRVNVLIAPEQADELFFSKKTAVVIDVLRASNTIITALENGAKEIIPVISVDSAVKISKGLFGGSTILGGERNTRKVEGFNSGNSPVEYSTEKVKGKTIIFFTTNGTKSILKAKFAESLYICSFRNMDAVVNQLVSSKNDIEILCAGNPGTFSIEDTVCAGMIISKIRSSGEKVNFSDSAKASEILYNDTKADILKMLQTSEHGRTLIENGFSDDVVFCSEINKTKVIPQFSGNLIKLKSTNQN